MKNLNTNLTAKIKTNNGLSRLIKRRTGGKQGGKNFGFLFAKMMDVLSEEMADDTQTGVTFDELRLSVLEWVDDVLTFAIDDEQQKYTLAVVNEFAIKHKLKWGCEKCNVMEISTSAYTQTKWTLGKEQIDSCD